jgi:type IV pilus assembly protein PilQ
MRSILCVFMMWLLVMAGFGLEGHAADADNDVAADLAPGAVTEEEPDPFELAEEIIGEEIANEDGALQVGPEGFVSFDIQDADIRVVLRMFSRRFNVNIVPSPSVQGTVSIQLNNVHWERALKTMLDMSSLITQRDEDIIRVLTAEEVEEEPLETRVYALGYTNASESEELIANLLTERGRVDVDEAGNRLIITDIPTRFQTIQDVIEELDKQTLQVLIEAKIIEKEAGQGSHFGIKWDFMEGYKIGMENISKSYTKSQFLVTDTVDKTSFTQTLDTTENQIPRNKVLDEGVASFESSKVVKQLGEAASAPLKTYRHIIKTATLSPADFELTISALLDNADIEILSKPRLITVDNRAAMIKVVEQIPIPSYQYNTETGRFEINSFEFKDIGIILNVTPHINKDDYITLDIVPEVSKTDSFIRFDSGGGSVAEIPIIDIRKTETRVIIRSGETLVIGGLITSDSTEVVKKVPLLGDIPIINVFFKHKSTEVNTNDLIIFITPTIVTENIEEASYAPGVVPAFKTASALGQASPSQTFSSRSGMGTLTIQGDNSGLTFDSR